MEYFIIENNGQQAGPFSLDQLVQKGITPETLVWKQGMKDWTPAWKLDDLKAVLEAVEADKLSKQPIQGFQQTQNFQQNLQQAYQQGYQQAQQQAYQQAYKQQGNQKKSSGHFALKVILGLIIIILAIFAVTNPGADSHKEKVRTEVSKAIEKATATTDNNFFTQALRSVAKMMADNVMGEAMDQLFVYHNYIVCSKGTVEFNGKLHTVSFGILGKVYTMNADDMVKALEDVDPISDPNNIEESSDEADVSDEEGLGAKVQKKLEDKANKAFDKAADKVSKKVEEKINQKLNEATDSSKIEEIIDKLLDLI